MSLAHFAVWYNVAKAGEQPSTSQAQPRYQLKNDQGLIYLRRKQACLQIATVTQESHGDDYYYHLLVLYLPWRNETVDLIGSHESAMALFVTNREKLQVLNSVENSSFTEEVQRATEQLRVLNQYGDAVYAPVAPYTTHMNMEINNEGQGLDPLYDQGLYQFTVNSPMRNTKREFRVLTDRRVPYEKIVEYTRAVLEYRMGNRESMPNPLRIFITGGAGTGKSHVISVIPSPMCSHW